MPNRRRPKEISHRNRSPYGWWIANFIERFEWKADGPPKPNARCLAWENTILIQAEHREVAYKKLLAVGKKYSRKWQLYGDPPGNLGRWVFEGPTSLLAIYEELEDGAEILFRVHSQRRIRTIRSFVKPKEKLESFID